jgi:hypothetical protein
MKDMAILKTEPGNLGAFPGQMPDRMSVGGHMWTRPALQEESDVRLRSGASHDSALFALDC